MTQLPRGQKRLPNGAARAALLPLMWRYGLAVLAFVLLLLSILAFRHFQIQMSLGLIIVATLIAVTWYGGTGPGLVVAILFEIATVAMSNSQQPSWPLFLFTEFNR